MHYKLFLDVSPLSLDAVLYVLLHLLHSHSLRRHTNKKYILSIDVGGIRGIISAIVLVEIEKRTRKRVAEIFDLMVGTSTGGIVVAGLCKKDE